MYLTERAKKSQHICIASKGIEQDSCLSIVNIVKKYINTKKICVISGGTFAVDMIKKVPLGLSLACKNKSTVRAMKKTLQNEYLKFYENELSIYNDLIYLISDKNFKRKCFFIFFNSKV